MALRTSGSIIELFHPFAKRVQLAQQAPAQEVGLRIKGTALQLRIVALGHPPPQVFPQNLQITQQHALELVAAFPVLRHAFHLCERPTPLAAVDRFPQRSRTPEITLGQPFDIPHALRCPATAWMKRSISSCGTEFMRLNGRSGYMYA